MSIENTIKELEERMKSYISEIACPCLENTPYIVEVGALTVGTTDTGVVIVENRNFPMQFSESAVNSILSMTFRNCNDEIVIPMVYRKNQWYSKQIEIITRVLKEFRKKVEEL